MELMERLRNMIVLKIARHPEPYLVLFDYNQAELERYAIHATLSELQQWFWLISEAERQIKFSPHPRFLLEMALAKMAQVQALEPLEDLDEQLDTLQELLANVQEEAPEVSPQPTVKPAISVQEQTVSQAAPASQHPPLSSTPASSSIPTLQRSYEPPSQDLTDTWNAVLDVIKQKRRGFAAALRHAVPLELTHNVLTLGFHPDTRFALSQLEDQNKVTIVHDAVQEHLGYDVQVRTTLYEGAVSAESMQEKLAQQPASQPMPEMPTQPYTPPGSSRTQTPSEGSRKSTGSSEWKGERKNGGKGEWKGRGNKQASQYKAPVQVSPQDIVRMFEGEIEE
jgi:DNA polymerase III gamma/tau subunit